MSVNIYQNGNLVSIADPDGHDIMDEEGNIYQKRGTLQFINATLTDDGTNGVTIVESRGGGGSAPIATTETAGIVKPDGTTITVENDGTIHSVSEVTPIATEQVAGKVKPDGSTITVDANGTISSVSTDVPIATVSSAGKVKPDGTTVLVQNDGTISANDFTGTRAQAEAALSSLPNGATIYITDDYEDAQTPIATTTIAGKVKPDGTTITVENDGTIHSVDSTPIATTQTVGTVKPDGTSITIDANGIISAAGSNPEYAIQMFAYDLTTGWASTWDTLTVDVSKQGYTPIAVIGVQIYDPTYDLVIRGYDLDQSYNRVNIHFTSITNQIWQHSTQQSKTVPSYETYKNYEWITATAQVLFIKNS